MRIFIILPFALFALLGCASAIVEGDIHGEPLNVKSAIFIEGVAGAQGSDKNVLTILVSDYPNLCERITDDEAQIEKLRAIVFLAFQTDNGRVVDIEEEKYDILGPDSELTSDGFVLASSVETNSKCEADADVAEDGTFEVQTYEQKDFLSFDFKTEFDGEDVTGEGVAYFCDVDAEDVLLADAGCEK